MNKKSVLRTVMMLLVVFLVMACPISSYAKNKTIGKSAKKITLTVGDQYKLKIKNTKVKWSAKSTSVLTLSKTGSIKALKEGKAKISYKVGGKTKKITVTVKKKAESAESKPETPSEEYVWLAATGNCYHSVNNCGRMNPSKARRVTLSYAQGQGYTRCSKCF